MLKAADLVLGKTYSKKMAKISLLDSMIKSAIDELAKDIECQILKKLQATLFFQSTDIPQLLHLLGYVYLKEGMMFCKLIETTCTAEDVFKFATRFFTIVYFGKNLWASALMVV